MDTNLITLETFRKTLNLGRDYCYEACRTGRLRAWKPSRRWMIPISEIRDFPLREIEARETN